MIRGGLKKTTTLASIPSSCGANVEDHDAQSKQQLNAMTPAEDYVVSATSPFHDEISRQGRQAQNTSDSRTKPKEEEGDTPRDIALT